jgi:SAM-dependent methyltransferase
VEYRAAQEEFAAALARLLDARPPLRVLDAGCGSDTNIVLPEGAHVVGIDISADALDRNAHVDEPIVGDLETIELPFESFDLIVCWDVLEHLRRPERALRTFARALAPGGLLVLGVPNVRSVKGLVTKYTPYALHRWIYSRAGSSRSAPHRTFLRFSIAPAAVRRSAGGAGLTEEYATFFEAPIQARMRRALRLSGWRWTVLSGLIRLVSLGAVATEDSDYLAIFAKRPS